MDADWVGNDGDRKFSEWSCPIWLWSTMITSTTYSWRRILCFTSGLQHLSPSLGYRPWLWWLCVLLYWGLRPTISTRCWTYYLCGPLEISSCLRSNGSTPFPIGISSILIFLHRCFFLGPSSKLLSLDFFFCWELLAYPSNSLFLCDAPVVLLHATSLSSYTKSSRFTWGGLGGIYAKVLSPPIWLLS